MSEFRYYEFLAVDRPLSPEDRTALRRISSRARISSNGFSNFYTYGDLRAAPLDLLARYFDFYIHWSDVGSRHFALKLPRGLIEFDEIGFEGINATVGIAAKETRVVIDLWREEIAESPILEDGTTEIAPMLASLVPLRAELLGGDTGLFTLIWLLGIEAQDVEDDAVEPGPVLLPASAALRALGEFLAIDSTLVDATFPTAPAARADLPNEVAIETWLRGLPDDEKVHWLKRLVAGDNPHVGAELRLRCKDALADARDASQQRPRLRTAGEIKAAAQSLREERRRKAAEAAAEYQRRDAQRRAQERKQHLADLAARGDGPWQEIDRLVARSQPASYDAAMVLLQDLREIATYRKQIDRFAARLATLTQAHARKGRFMERLAEAGMLPGLPFRLAPT